MTKEQLDAFIERQIVKMWPQVAGESITKTLAIQAVCLAGANIVAPLFLQAVNQLKEECCCAKEPHGLSGELIECDACEVREKIEAVVKAGAK